MSGKYYGDYKNTQKRSGVSREPVMTLKELSDSNSIPYSTLAGKFKKTGGDIKPEMELSRGRKYYKKTDLDNWIKENIK